MLRGLILGVVLFPGISFAIDPSPFSLRATGPDSTSDLFSVIHANEQFIAVGAASNPPGPYGFGPAIVRYSLDGVNWGLTELTNAFAPSLHDVVHANGLYVGVGGREGGNLWTSSDGTNWTLQSEMCCAFSGVTSGPQGFVAVGGFWPLLSTVIVTSPDGIIWTSRDSGITNNFITDPRRMLAVTYGNGRYVAVGATGSIVTSLNAANWTPISEEPTTNHLGAIIFTNGGFLAVGTSGVTLKSVTGTAWTQVTTGITNTLRAITYANGTYVVVGDGGVIATSTDGNTWSRARSDVTTALYGVCYGNGTFVVVGEGGVILQSPDFLRPGLQIVSGPSGFDVVVSLSEFGRQYRVEASATPAFMTPTTLGTYANSHTNIVIRDGATNTMRFYRVISP